MTDDNRAFCTSCGALLSSDSVFCQECGSPVAEPDRIYSEGPGLTPETFNRYQQDFLMAKAESRLKRVRFLMVGYMILGTIIALSGLFYEQLLNSLPLDDPTFESLLGENYYDEMYAMVDQMWQLGIVFIASVLLILGSLVLSSMRRHHLFATGLCAIGSVALFFSMSPDGIIFAIIGLIVTYFLYTTKVAFID